MNTFTDKIKALEAEMSETDKLLQSNLINIETMKPEIEKFTLELREAKKLHVLDPSSELQKKINEAQKKLDGIQHDFDRIDILAEALQDKKNRLETELAAAKISLAEAEVDRLSGKVHGLVDAYIVLQKSFVQT